MARPWAIQLRRHPGHAASHTRIQGAALAVLRHPAGAQRARVPARHDISAATQQREPRRL